MTLIMSWRIVGLIAPTGMIRIDTERIVIKSTFCYVLDIRIDLIEVPCTVAGGF